MREAINDILDNGMTSFTAENRATGTAISLGMTMALGGLIIAMLAPPVGMAFSAMAALNVIGVTGLGVAAIGAATAVGAVVVHDIAALGKTLLSPFRNKETRTVTNKAGQDVRGPSWALAALDETQAKIDKIIARFNGAALPASAEERVERLENNAHRAVDAVKVTCGGPSYQFAH